MNENPKKKNLPLRYRLILQKPFFIKTISTTERKKERSWRRLYSPGTENRAGGF
jgi:hypothetical protein